MALVQKTDVASYQVKNDIATITITRPDVMNGLNTELRVCLLEFLNQAIDQSRVIILTGEGNAFCSGQDLSEFSSPSDINFKKILNEEYVPLLKTIYESSVPVIAAVNGTAAGAGANLALAADVVIATQSARFIQSFSRIGLAPDAGGTYWLPRQIGFGRAMGAALFAEPISADKAEEWGMIWQSVSDENFKHVVNERALHLATGAGKSFAYIKKALRAAYDNNLNQQLLLEAELQSELGLTEDFSEGVNAFMEKRKPNYQGK